MLSYHFKQASLSITKWPPQQANKVWNPGSEAQSHVLQEHLDKVNQSQKITGGKVIITGKVYKKDTE